MQRWTIMLGLAAGTLSGAALAQTVAPAPAPAPAPAAQQAAPPDKYGAPIHAKTPAATIKQPETTGDAPKSLSPGRGKDATQQPGPLPMPQDRRQ